MNGTEKQIKYANDILSAIKDVIIESKEINKAEIENEWENMKESKKQKFGTKENLINSRIEKIEKIENEIMNIEDASQIIETFKNVLNKDMYFKAKELKEIGMKKEYNTMFINSMQKIQNKYYGK